MAFAINGVSDHYDWSSDIYRNGRCVFTWARELVSIPTTDKIRYQVGNELKEILIDGVAVYSDKLELFKFYLTDTFEVPIKGINWNESNKGSFIPVPFIESTEFQDRIVTNPNINGIGNLLSMKAGVGATVKIGFINSTIPKIIEVIEGSETYDFPTCPHCGTQLSLEESMIGGNLKCHNKLCKQKIDHRLWMLKTKQEEEWFNPEGTREYLNTKLEFITRLQTHTNWLVGEVLNVEGMNAHTRIKISGEDEYFNNQGITHSIVNDHYDQFKLGVEARYNFSDLQAERLEYVIEATFTALKQFYNSLT